MVKALTYLISGLLIGVLLGMLIYRNSWFPISTYRKVAKTEDTMDLRYPYGIFYTKYRKGVPLFSDRAYFDIIGDSTLQNSYVLQIKRHWKSLIQIDLKNDVIVYRILAESNDNSFYDDWEKSNIEVFVKGESCTHTIVVYKKFSGGIIQLPSGGPVASSPLLLKNLSNEPMNSIKVNGVLIDDKYGLTTCEKED